MADTTIEWTEKVWNPVTGCTKVSQGCKNCYAERVFPRAYGATGRKFTDVAIHVDRLDQPLRRKKPALIFVNSMSDLFHERVKERFLDMVFAVMALCPRHTFQVLTKRPERMLEYFRDSTPLQNHRVSRWFGEFMREHKMGVATWPGWPLPNVWLGVSCEDQKTADERIPLLLQTPAAVRWISAEPLLGKIDLGRISIPSASGLQWVVAGGESGPGARPMHPDWARSLRDQCAAAGVPFFFKQWGEWQPGVARYVQGDAKNPKAGDLISVEFEGGGKTTRTKTQQLHRWDDRIHSASVGKKAAGRMLDGREWNEYPNQLERQI